MTARADVVAWQPLAAAPDVAAHPDAREADAFAYAPTAPSPDVVAFPSWFGGALSGQYVPPPITGTLAITLDDFTLLGVGNIPVTGQLSITLGAITLTGGNVTVTSSGGGFPIRRAQRRR